MRILKNVFLISTVVFLLLQFIYYPHMPENVAIHFNANGDVNGWMPKAANLIFSCFISVIVTVAFIGVPYILKNTPPNLINVPKKEYWLSLQNIDRLINILTGYMYFIGFATNLFMIYLFYQLYRFNIHAIDNVSMIVIIPYLFCLLGSIIHLLVRLNKCT
jgi:uncharacterized membrane protein